MSSRAGSKRKAAEGGGNGGGKAKTKTAPRQQRAPAEASYAIRCSRVSKLIEYDDDTFTDCYGDEVTDAERNVDDAVEAEDGSWLYNLPLRASSSGKQGSRLAVFKSLEGATARAVQVWVDLQRNHPFVRVADPSAGGKDDDDDEDEESDEHVDDGGEDSPFKKLSASGLPRWERKQDYYVDPYGSDLKNLASSTLTVEVVPVDVLP